MLESGRAETKTLVSSLNPLSRMFKPKPRFRGGLPLPGHKAESTRGPILRAPLPPLLICR